MFLHTAQNDRLVEIGISHTYLCKIKAHESNNLLYILQKKIFFLLKKFCDEFVQPFSPVGRPSLDDDFLV